MSELSIDTTGWVRCGIPGCRWLLDPELRSCPEHSDRPMFVADPDDPEAVAEAKRLARGENPIDRGGKVDA